MNFFFQTHSESSVEWKKAAVVKVKQGELYNINHLRRPSTVKYIYITTILPFFAHSHNEGYNDPQGYEGHKNRRIEKEHVFESNFIRHSSESREVH